MKKRQIIILGSSILLFGGLIGLSAVLGGMKEPEEKKKRVNARKFVATAPVSYREVPTSIEAYGRLQSKESLDITAEKGGKLKSGSVALKSGERFKKGTLLFTIDSEEEVLNLRASKSNFLSEIAGILPYMQIDHPQSHATWKEYFNTVDITKPLPALPTPRTEKERTFLATKNIFNTYYSLKSREVALNKYSQYAPFEGTYALVTAANGSVVNPGTRVATIKQTDELELKVAVKLSDIAWVEKGQSAVLSDEQSGKKWEGTINRIGAVVNEQTQSIDVFIKVSNQRASLYDGMYLQASIPGKAVPNALEIPRAVLGEGNEVYTIEQDSILKVHTVEVHKLNAGTAVISGLQPGADLVMEPMVNAANNMRVFKLEDADKYPSLIVEEEEED